MTSNLILVLPCFNEAARLPVDDVRVFLGANPAVGILFVNDGSTDQTLKVIEDARASLPGQVEVLDLDQNQGKAEAVRLGMARAMEGNATFAGFWDADLATALDVAPLLVEIMESRPQLDMVFGSRVQLLGRQIHRALARHYLGRIFATTVSLLLGIRVYDTQCGAKIFRISPVTRSLFDSPFTSRWIFDVELIARYLKACRAEGRDPLGGMYEEPLPAWRDVGGSKVRSGDFIAAFLDLIRIYRRYRPRG